MVSALSLYAYITRGNQDVVPANLVASAKVANYDAGSTAVAGRPKANLSASYSVTYNLYAITG